MSNYVRNGRGSAHTGGEWSQWQRHNDHCIARGYVRKNGKPCTRCRGARETREVRFFSLLVSLVMTGESLRLRDGRRVKVKEFLTLTRWELVHAEFVCPITGEWVRVEDAQSDRIVPGVLGGEYRPGNIALISARANLAKSDAAPSADYADRVATATAKVRAAMGVPRNNGMVEEWHNVVRAASKDEREALAAH